MSCRFKYGNICKCYLLKICEKLCVQKMERVCYPIGLIILIYVKGKDSWKLSLPLTRTDTHTQSNRKGKLLHIDINTDAHKLVYGTVEGKNALGILWLFIISTAILIECSIKLPVEISFWWMCCCWCCFSSIAVLYIFYREITNSRTESPPESRGVFAKYVCAMGKLAFVATKQPKANQFIHEYYCVAALRKEISLGPKIIGWQFDSPTKSIIFYFICTHTHMIFVFCLLACMENMYNLHFFFFYF